MPEANEVKVYMGLLESPRLFGLFPETVGVVVVSGLIVGGAAFWVPNVEGQAAVGVVVVYWVVVGMWLGQLEAGRSSSRPVGKLRSSLRPSRFTPHGRARR